MKFKCILIYFLFCISSLHLKSQIIEEALYVVADNPGLFCEATQLTVIGDSLILSTKFFNYSKNKLALYKPMLPDNKYATIECISLMNEAGLIDSRKREAQGHGNNYIKDSNNLYPIVIPSIANENILFIEGSDSVEFTLNLSRVFNIRELSAKKNYSVQYCVFMPAIDAKRLAQNITEIKQKIRRKKSFVFKPVYFRIGSNILSYPLPDYDELRLIRNVP